MTNEQKENLRLALKALRENPKKAKGQLRDNQGGRCCLCVMGEVAEDINNVKRNSYTPLGAALPLSILADVFGLRNIEYKGSPKFNFLLEDYSASCLNDGIEKIDEHCQGVEEKSHAEIANMIEIEYLK